MYEAPSQKHNGSRPPSYPINSHTQTYASGYALLAESISQHRPRLHPRAMQRKDELRARVKLVGDEVDGLRNGLLPNRNEV